MKERYSIENFYIEDLSVLIDNDTHQVILTLRDYCYDEINFLENLLNEQDEKIKELENMNSRLSKGIYWGNGEQFCDVVKRLKQENQQLKKSQNSKAIEVLEKVRKFYNLNSDIDWIIDLCKLDEYVNNQIAKLKEINGK